MKLINYQLQNQIEYFAEEKTNNFLKSIFKGILEDTSKPYYQKEQIILDYL